MPILLAPPPRPMGHTAAFPGPARLAERLPFRPQAALAGQGPCRGLLLSSALSCLAGPDRRRGRKQRGPRETPSFLRRCSWQGRLLVLCLHPCRRLPLGACGGKARRGGGRHEGRIRPCWLSHNRICQSSPSLLSPLSKPLKPAGPNGQRGFPEAGRTRILQVFAREGSGGPTSGKPSWSWRGIIWPERLEFSC